MKDPIFKNEKVHDWGGGRVSGLGPEPYPRTRARYQLMEGIFCDPQFKERVREKVKGSKIVIYGMALVGKALVSALRNDYEIPFCIDKAMNGCNYENIPIYSANHLQGLDHDATVIVSLDRNESPVIELMKREGFIDAISIKEVVPCE